MTPKWLPKALIKRVANSSVGPSSDHKGGHHKDGTTSSPMNSKSNRRKVDALPFGRYACRESHKGCPVEAYGYASHKC